MRVHVCDDDQELRVFLRTMFEVEGWHVTETASGESLLESLDDAAPPDVLVLDQVMPVLTGIETAARLRDSGFAQPIVLCSGHLGPELAEDIDSLGLTPCNKIDVQALVRVVRAAWQDGRRERRRRAEKHPAR